MKTITHDEFTKKYLNRYIEYADPTNLFQCVDMMRRYMVEVLGVPPYSIPRALYAKDIYKNFVANQYFRKIKNTPDNVPRKGDILFLGYYPRVTGWAGHVGVVDSADVMKLVLFNQNYPTSNPCDL